MVFNFKVKRTRILTIMQCPEVLRVNGGHRFYENTVPKGDPFWAKSKVRDHHIFEPFFGTQQIMPRGPKQVKKCVQFTKHIVLLRKMERHVLKHHCMLCGEDSEKWARDPPSVVFPRETVYRHCAPQ